jgi:hypothetical protein
MEGANKGCLWEDKRTKNADFVQDDTPCWTMNNDDCHFSFDLTDYRYQFSAEDATQCISKTCTPQTQ